MARLAEKPPEMAGLAEKPTRQHSEGEYLVRLDKGRRITMFLNGDQNFFGTPMLVNRKQTRTWDAFLNASTQKTGVTTAVRQITTPETGTFLSDIDDLRDKQSYVAITRGKFKPLGYTTLFDRHKQYLATNVHHTSSILKIRPVEHSSIQVPGKIAKIPIHSIIINVFVNGKNFDPPFRIPLSSKVLRSWNLVLKEIGEHITSLVPKTLYSVDGTRVISQSADLQPNGKYVIVGNEPGGFRPYCYGCFTRAKTPKKLPPVKRRRRHKKGQDMKNVIPVVVVAENPAEATKPVSLTKAEDMEAEQSKTDAPNAEPPADEASSVKPDAEPPADEASSVKPDAEPPAEEASSEKPDAEPPADEASSEKPSTSRHRVSPPVHRTTSEQVLKVLSTVDKPVQRAKSERSVVFPAPPAIIPQEKAEGTEVEPPNAEPTTEKPPDTTPGIKSPEESPEKSEELLASAVGERTTGVLVIPVVVEPLAKEPVKQEADSPEERTELPEKNLTAEEEIQAMQHKDDDQMLEEYRLAVGGKPDQRPTEEECEQETEENDCEEQEIEEEDCEEAVEECDEPAVTGKDQLAVAENPTTDKKDGGPATEEKVETTTTEEKAEEPKQETQNEDEKAEEPKRAPSDGYLHADSHSSLWLLSDSKERLAGGKTSPVKSNRTDNENRESPLKRSATIEKVNVGSDQQIKESDHNNSSSVQPTDLPSGSTPPARKYEPSESGSANELAQKRSYVVKDGSNDDRTERDPSPTRINSPDLDQNRSNERMPSETMLKDKSSKVLPTPRSSQSKVERESSQTELDGTKETAKSKAGAQPHR